MFMFFFFKFFFTLFLEIMSSLYSKNCEEISIRFLFLINMPAFKLKTWIFNETIVRDFFLYIVKHSNYSNHSALLLPLAFIHLFLHVLLEIRLRLDSVMQSDGKQIFRRFRLKQDISGCRQHSRPSISKQVISYYYYDDFIS